jgi:hypothetical protein
MTHEELVRAKTAHKAAIAAAAPGAIWRLVKFATAQEAVDFANVPPVQKGGEFTATDDPIGGGIAGFYFF